MHVSSRKTYNYTVVNITVSGQSIQIAIKRNKSYFYQISRPVVVRQIKRAVTKDSIDDRLRMR